MKEYIKVIFILLVLASGIPGYAQFLIQGSIVDPEGNALVGASVTLQETGDFTITDEVGIFEFNLTEPGDYTVIAYYISHTSERKKVQISKENPEAIIDFTLELDPLQLSQIIIIDQSSTAPSLALSQKISSKSGEELLDYNAYGTSDLLSNISGVFTDASAGEVFSRVYTRGISISAEDDLGWFYVSLQEDGLPVSATQHTYYSPDLFHRMDITVDRLEGVNGGKSALLAPNAPGALFDFKSKSGSSDAIGSIYTTVGIEGDGNPVGRIDALFAGPLADQWYYMIGGFYRNGDGPRDVEIDWNKGGQIKANITRNARDYRLKIYGKYLRDHTNRWYGLPATNWNDPMPAFGVSFNHSALLLPPVTADLPDGRMPNQSYLFNSDNGILTRDAAIGLDYSRALGNWTLRNNVKFSSKKADWQNAIGNQPLGLSSFFPYLLSGISPDFSVLPLGNVVFRNPQNNEILASVNNFGILGPLMGEAPSFEYNSGNLPNDAVMGIAPWKKIDAADEWINRLSLSGLVGDHEVYGSLFYARSTISTFTSANFAYTTYEPNPSLLRVTLENPGEPVIQLSDDEGLSNYGGLLYNAGEATVSQWAITLNDKWKINDYWTLDIGGQYSKLNQEGVKDNFEPQDLDNNPLTAFNNSFLTKMGESSFDLTYDHLSWSSGLVYQINSNAAFYGRYTLGNKSPELNYAFNNFQNLPVPGPGKIQKIKQAEMGYRTRNNLDAFAFSAFWSKLSNVAFSEFVFDEENGTIFFTPEQLNATTTWGVNLEGYHAFSRFLRITARATLQNPKASTFTVYDAAGTGSLDDDQIYDFSGNQIPHNPRLLFEVSPELSLSKNRIYLSYRYVGAREGNIENSFTLPAFGTLNAGIDFAYNDQITLQVSGRNLTNSAGLMNFFGPNEFGSSANAATSDYIATNPDASFVVFPILPRSIYLKLAYDF